MYYWNKLRHTINLTAMKEIFSWSECIHRSLIIICILDVLTSVTSLGLTVTTKFLIDGALNREANTLVKYGSALAAIIIVETGIYLLMALIRSKASAKLQRSMQTMLIRELMLKDYSGLRGYHSGELVNRLFSDVAVVKSSVISVLPQLFSMPVSFVGAAVILICLDGRFVILLIVGGIVGTVIILLFKQPLKARHKRMREAEGAFHAYAQETLENLRLIKASGSEEKAVERLEIQQKGLEHEQIRRDQFSAEMSNGIGLIFDLSWFFCMIWGCIGISQGQLTYGALAAIIQLIGRIQEPISDAVDIAGKVYAAVASAERIRELTELPEEEEGTALEDFDEIRAENVSFRYDDSAEDVLENISFTIRKGEFAALTGISGGGKTSLFQLLLGIYKPTSGKMLFIQGEHKTEACRRTRKLFAYVPQGNTLFSGTLRDNLTMFAGQVSDDEIHAACRAACIDGLVNETGLEAHLGEKGLGISEGQAQRIAIARALLSKAPILLFDEATSALDDETEAKLLENIAEMHDKSCIIVTHRRAALDICDYELHLKEGRVSQKLI